MELKKIIEIASDKAGSQKKLGEIIGISSLQLTNAKAGRAGIPVYACVMIADLIGIDRIAVIAASELITEKKEERRAIWHPFVSHAASVIMGAVILNMTPAPANASELIELNANSLNAMYIMSN